MNQKRKRYVLVGLMSLFLTACMHSSIQTQEGEEESENGPLQLAGMIVEGIYRSRIGYLGRHFSVAIPQARDEYEYSHMWRSDEQNFFDTRATFGPAALDGTIYRVWVSKKGDSLETFRKEKLAEALQLAQSTNGFPLHAGEHKALKIKGRRALFDFYDQPILDTKNELLPYYNKGMYSHAFYFIEVNDDAALLWVQATTGGGMNAIDKLGQKQMINGKFEPQTYFVNSFNIEQ